MKTLDRLMIFTDHDIQEDLTAGDALVWAHEALIRHTTGALSAPPRSYVDLGDGHLVITAGQSGADWYGYRCYDTLPTTHDEQTVVVHDAAIGQVVAVAFGTELGARRTGALGGVAAKTLTGGAIAHLAIIGTGRQA